MAIYAASALGTDVNKLHFNDYNGQFHSGIVFRVKARQPQRRQIRELDIPVPFENGISDFETLIGQTAYVIDGTMYPAGESSSDAGLQLLRDVCSLELNQADILSDHGYVPYVWTEFNQQKQLFVKPLYVQLVETTRGGLVQDFRIICKVKDPTIYGSELQEANTGQADFGIASGTAVHAFAFPIIYGASTASVSVDANNAGSLPVYPVGINIYGPVSSPIITNTTTGEFIRVNTSLATVSNNLSIAYDKDSLSVTRDGVSVLSLVTSDSTYFKIQPGSNIFSLTGTSIDDEAYAVISFRNGYPLS